MEYLRRAAVAAAMELPGATAANLYFAAAAGHGARRGAAAPSFAGQIYLLPPAQRADCISAGANAECKCTP